jgi:hypothetical protein
MYKTLADANIGFAKSQYLSSRTGKRSVSSSVIEFMLVINGRIVVKNANTALGSMELHC